MDTDEKEVSSQSWNKLQRSLHQEGYREGSSAGRESTFQKGFDSGYLQGFQVGYELGLHNGILKCLSSDVTNFDSTVKEHLSTVQSFEKPSRGLCVVCSDEEKASKNGNKETEGEDQTAKNVSEVIQEQKKALTAAKKSVLTDEYLLVLRTTNLNEFINTC
uniref:Essential protein Yae1 N-terminal domain-containing protein n=2 Tax=Cuerna arida TaxID=1464854 RepID=A0A1B6EHX4_9HEMI